MSAPAADTRPGPVAKEGSSAAASHTNADIVMQCLVRSGVTHIFGQSIPPALMQLCGRYGVRQVGYRTENAGGVMADGYARVSGKLGVVAAQNGPAATLLVPPMAEALKASIPLLALVQDVSRQHTGKNAFQEYDHEALFSGCTKWIGRIDRADLIETQVEAAIRNAISGRPGPVILLLPMDLLAESAAVVLKRRPTPIGYPLTRSVPERSALEAAAGALASAARPLVVAGGGVHSSGAQGALAAFQHEFGLPVATTNMGKGAVSELHPLSIGVVGNCMGASAPSHGMKDYVRTADVVLLAGTRTNQNGTNSWTLFAPDANFIHIDVDALEIGRNYDALALVGDVRETLFALADCLRVLPARAANAAQDAGRIAESRCAAAAALQARVTPSAAGVRPEAVMQALAELLPAGSIVAADASYSTNWVATYLPARQAGDRFLMPRGLAGLGWGLPLAMGAKVAKPGARVVALVGDGGFGHCWSELETAQREGIAVVVIVLNNGILGYQKHAEEVNFGASTAACDFQSVDHAQIARACGCAGLRIASHADIAPMLAAAFAEERPVVVDVITDPAAKPPLAFFEPK